ncbi:unnamed protein product, partial [Trichogramma brassicae]
MTTTRIGRHAVKITRNDDDDNYDEDYASPDTTEKKAMLGIICTYAFGQVLSYVSTLSRSECVLSPFGQITDLILYYYCCHHNEISLHVNLVCTKKL